MKIEMGHSYLIKEKKPVRSFEIFRSGLAQDIKGICISTTPKVHLDLPESTLCMWLNTVKTDGSFDPANLQKIYHEIAGFTEKNGEVLILLDGLETMILNSDFHRVQKFLDSLKTLTISKKSLAIIPVNTDALDPKESAYLERILDVIE